VRSLVPTVEEIFDRIEELTVRGCLIVLAEVRLQAIEIGG
jgi:hypothetical protein